MTEPRRSEQVGQPGHPGIKLRTDGEFEFRDSNREALFGTFSRYVKPLIYKKDPRILSVGCGFSLEAKPVTTIFEDAVFVGIDSNDKFISASQRMNSDVKGNVTFKVADARQEGAFGNENWDLIIVRHPQIKGSFLTEETTGDWGEILGNCVKFLGKEGVLFVSTQDSREKDLVIRTLGRNGATVIIDEINPNPSPGPFPDTDIIVAKKT